MLDIKKIKMEYVTNREGEKTAVIVPIENFYELMEDIEDLAAVAERREEPTISHDQLVAELKQVASYKIRMENLCRQGTAHPA
jgi:hypothetical protein